MTPDRTGSGLRPSARFGTLDKHPDYTWEVCLGEVDIDISNGDCGWSGCGHPGEITLTGDDVTRMLDGLKEAARG